MAEPQEKAETYKIDAAMSFVWSVSGDAEMRVCWKPIPGYEGIYEVSDQGDVWRLPGTPKCKAGRLLRPRRGKTGYLTVQLFGNGKHGSHYIHRLVLAAFVGPCPDGHNANHLDLVKSHNALANLAYTSFAANSQHARAAGAWSDCEPLRGEAHGSATITEAQARAVKADLAALKPGETGAPAIAMRHGVSVHIVRLIRANRIWKHL